MKKINLIILILAIGVIHRLIISYDNNFIFNMDNARDMVDVREIVALGKLRLIGQTTAVEGFFYGPAWYYILAVPFILTGGNPYGSILLEILMWVLGGYYLLLLTQKYYGKLALIPVGCLWVASNFILLASQYAFNPNPIIFLTPVFVYFLIEFLEKKNLLSSLIIFLLAGLFLHFEIAVGIFMPVIIFLSIIIFKEFKVFKNKNLYLGILVFILTLVPQALFELRHDFFLTKSLLAYKSGSHGGVTITPIERFSSILHSYYDTILPTFMNFSKYLDVSILLFFVSLVVAFKKRLLFKNKITIILLLLLFVPLIGLIPLKVDLMRWHLNSVIVAAIFVTGFIANTLYNSSKVGKVVVLLLSVSIIFFTAKNMTEYIQAAKRGDSNNSILRNELSVVDYIYKQANGKNFKVYTYMPSVIDYPYQYLFWWRGLKKYGYLPQDYAYLPNKPEYIKYKDRLDVGLHPESSGLIFLIKEPDQIGQRHLWENSFKALPQVDQQQIGAIIVETRKDINP